MAAASTEFTKEQQRYMILSLSPEGAKTSEILRKNDTAVWQ
jgi:hypothetical protein